MDNQHKLIKGYRDLTPEEIALMNEIKDAGQMLEALIGKVDAHLLTQLNATNPRYRTPASEDPEHVDNVVGTELLDTPEETAAKKRERERINRAQSLRWAAIARTDLQTGLMALVRAVAQPTTF